MNTTDIRYSDIPMCIDSVSARAAQLGDDGLQMNCVRRAVSCLHNQAPNLNTMTSCDGIHWHQVQWHYYVYWFCECQSWRTGGRMVSKWMYEGEQSHAYIIKHPSQHNWLLVMEYTDIRYSDITTLLILWVPEQHNWRTDGSNELCEGEQSHAYIIKHPISTQLTPCDGIHSHSGTVTLLRVLILWVPELENWGRMVSNELCEGSSLMLT